MGAPNGYSNLDDFLDIPFGSVLVLHGDHATDQVKAIRERHPSTRIVLRLYGGIGGSPDDLAREISRLYLHYAQWGVHDWIAWNEPDRTEEGGFSVEYTAVFADRFLSEIRRLSPDIRIHWPAWAHEQRYQDNEQYVWIPVAQKYDVIDFHAYLSVDYLRAFLRWHSSFFPDKEWMCTEFNFGLGNAKPTNYGKVLYEAYEEAYKYPQCSAVHPFIWEWINPEPGGEILNIAGDRYAILGVRQAAIILPSQYEPSPPQPPEPPPDPPPPTPEPRRPNMNPIKKSMMLWQHNNCREQTVNEWVETLAIGDIDTFRVKSHQHLNWMGNVYSHPLVPKSLDSIKRLYEEFGAKGIHYIPWCVPMGLDVPQEVNLAVAVAKACGGHIDIDLEPYPEFWDVNRVGNGRIPEYFDRLRQSGITVFCDFDARGNLADPLGLERITHLVDRFLTQSYWVGFGSPYSTVIRHAVSYMQRIGAREMGIVLDARGGRDIPLAAELAQSLGCIEVSCWSADLADLRTYEGFGDIPTDPMFSPSPEPPNDSQVLLSALGEQYRIVHQILHPMIGAKRRGEAEAAIRTYDEQLNIIKSVLKL